MRKTKGYSKGGVKMMKAMGGRMASKGGKKMMGAMKGKMAKGYAKGKMMKAMKGKMAKGYSKGGIKKFNAGNIAKLVKQRSQKPGMKFTVNDIKVADRLMKAGMLSKTAFNKLNANRLKGQYAQKNKFSRKKNALE
jgi:hypothetical protein